LCAQNLLQINYCTIKASYLPNLLT